MSVTISGSGQIVKQVIQVVKSDTFSTTSASFVPITGLSVNITPTNSANKILVIVDVVTGQASSGNNVTLQMQRNGSAIYAGNAADSRSVGITGGNQSSDTTLTTTAMYLDSPATTSSTTYSVSALTSSGGTMYVNRSGDDTDIYYRGRTASSITVMEIAYA